MPSTRSKHSKLTTPINSPEKLFRSSTKGILSRVPPLPRSTLPREASQLEHPRELFPELIDGHLTDNSDDEEGMTTPAEGSTNASPSGTTVPPPKPNNQDTTSQGVPQKDNTQATPQGTTPPPPKDAIPIPQKDTNTTNTSKENQIPLPFNYNFPPLGEGFSFGSASHQGFHQQLGTQGSLQLRGQTPRGGFGNYQPPPQGQRLVQPTHGFGYLNNPRTNNTNQPRNQQNQTPLQIEEIHEIEDDDTTIYDQFFNNNEEDGNNGVHGNNGRRMTIIERMSRRREGTGSSINLPPVPANTQLILSSHIMSSLTDNTFSGDELEDAQDHVDTITEIMNGYNVAGINEDQLMLRVFPRTLTGKAKKWLKLLPPNSITTWERLKTKFIDEYTTPSMINKKKQKITTFTQEDGETLYQAWTRFQELLRACPQHNLDSWEILDRFYNAMDINTRLTLDGGGPFLHLPDTVAFKRLEVLAKYSQDYHESSKKKKVVKRIDNDDEEEDKGEIRALKAMIEGTDRKVEKLTKSLYAMAVGCDKCGGPHLPKDCKNKQAKAVTFEDDEEANYVSNGNWEERQGNKVYQGSGGFFRERPNQRNYNNDRPYQNNRNYNNNYNNNDQRNQQPQGQPQQDPLARLEGMIGTFVATSSKRHDEAEGTLRNQQASIHNIEKQVGQIAQVLQERMPGSLPGFTKTNPNAQ